MRNLLLAVSAMASLLVAVPSAQAAPAAGASSLLQHSTSSVENVTFFRCGVFGERCRDYRRGHRGYGNYGYRGYRSYGSYGGYGGGRRDYRR